MLSAVLELAAIPHSCASSDFRCSGDQTVLDGVNEIFLCWWHYLSHADNLAHVHKIFRVLLSWVRTGTLTVSLYSGVSVNFLPVRFEWNSLREMCTRRHWEFVSFVKTAASKAVLLLWTYMQLQLHVYSENVCRSDSKKPLDKFCIPRRVVRYLPFGFVKNMAVMQLFLEHKEHKVRNVRSLQLKTRLTNYLICWSSDICSTSDGN